MHFLRAAFEKPLDGVLELRAPHDRVLEEQQSLVLDDLADRDQLHPRDEVADALVLRHETARPGRRVLGERPAVWDLDLVGVADRVADARVRDAGDHVDLHVVFPREHRAAAIARVLDIDPFVAGRGKSVVHPEEGADLHAFSGRPALFHAVRRDPHNLAWPQVPRDGIAEVRKCAGLHGDRVGPVLLAQDHRGAPQPVARGVDSLFREEEDRGRSLHRLLRFPDAVFERGLLVDQRGDDLRRIDLVAAHFGEMSRALAERPPCQFLGVLDDTHRDDRVRAEVRADDQRLVLVIADDPDAGVAVKTRDIVLEFRAELRVGNVMDESRNGLRILHGESAALRTEMRVVVRPVEEIRDAILF